LTCKQNKEKYLNILVTNTAVNKRTFLFHIDNEHQSSVLKISDRRQLM